MQGRKRGRFRLLLSLCCAATLLLLSMGALHARGPQETVLRLINEGRFAEARAFAAGLGDGGRVTAGNVAFVEALILKRTGRLEQAAGLLGELLDRDPASSAVRQELAHTLYLIGDDDRARYHFEHLKETMASGARRAVYDRFLAAIRDRRPWKLEGSIGFAPSTNINDGTPGNTVYIGGVPFTNDNAAKSGVGLSYTLSGSYNFKLGNGYEWVVGGGLSGASYTRSSFDRLRLAAFSELAAETTDWRIAGGIAAERMLGGWKGYSSGIGPYLFMRRSLGGRGTLESRASWTQRNYDTIRAYDGSEAAISASYRHIVSSRLAVRAGLSASHVRTRNDFTSFVGVRPSLSADYIFSKDLILHGSVGYEARRFRGNFPLQGKPREDARISLGVGATLRGLTWKGFVPRLDYEYFHADSNVALFERRNHSFGVSVVKRY